MIGGRFEGGDPLQAEAEFTALGNQGLETAEIVRQLGLKLTTVQSQARYLQRRGLIQPRL